MLDVLNAFVYRDETANGGDDGCNGPLAGMTVGVKANIAVKDMPFHAGIGAWENRRADADAQVITLLREAGAAIVGIVNMEEGALGAKTDNPHFGPTQNPHHLGYSPGGSSGGSGAAVAAGFCDFALGTDTMGSVRIPAAHCGIYGFKPATKNISQAGLEPADLSLDAIGAMARNLELLQRACETISDIGDAPLPGNGAILTEHGVDVKPDVAQVFERALGALDRAPAKTRLSYPQSRIRFAGFIQISTQMAAHLRDVAVSGHLAKLLNYGPKRSSTGLTEDRGVLTITRDEVRDLVAKHGFLIMPTVPNPPFPHSQAEPADQADFTCLANIAGLPALSIPAGWTDTDLPIGIQLVGPIGCEQGLFALTRQLDSKLEAYRPPVKPYRKQA